MRIHQSPQVFFSFMPPFMYVKNPPSLCSVLLKCPYLAVGWTSCHILLLDRCVIPLIPVELLLILVIRESDPILPNNRRTWLCCGLHEESRIWEQKVWSFINFFYFLFLQKHFSLNLKLFLFLQEKFNKKHIALTKHRTELYCKQLRFLCESQFCLDLGIPVG